MERITFYCEKTIYNLFLKKRRKKKLFMATYLENDKFKNKKLIQMSDYLWGNMMISHDIFIRSYTYELY